MRRVVAIASALVAIASGVCEAGDRTLRAWALSGQVADAWSTQRGLARGYGVEGNPAAGWLVREPVRMYAYKMMMAEGASHLMLGLARGADRKAEGLERQAFAPGLEREERERLLRAARGERSAARWARRFPVLVGAVGWGAFAWNMGAGGRYCHAHPNADRCR